MMRTFLFTLATVIFTACNTVNYIGIETYNPAEVTFPKGVGKVLIVNNALPQPETDNYIYTIEGEKQRNAKAKADSALFDACRVLGEAIAGSSYFNDVLLYHNPTRDDNSAYVDRKLTSEQVDSLCGENYVDAIISIDRLLFDMKREVSNFANAFYIGTVNVKMAGVIRCHIPGRESPLTTIQVSDSIQWAESADYVNILDKILPTPENALRGAAEYFGAKAYTNFVPHWEKETRWYFGGAGARWKEASAFASNEKWDEAMEKWKLIYQSSNSWKGRAKAASNLALCHEMKGELKEAYEWAHKSYEMFKSKSGENDNTTSLLELYVKALAQRINSDKKLNSQFE